MRISFFFGLQTCFMLNLVNSTILYGRWPTSNNLVTSIKGFSIVRRWQSVFVILPRSYTACCFLYFFKVIMGSTREERRQKPQSLLSESILVPTRSLRLKTWRVEEHSKVETKKKKLHFQTKRIRGLKIMIGRHICLTRSCNFVIHHKVISKNTDCVVV